MPSYLHKDTGAEPTRPKRQLRLRRVPILLLLVLLATSCNRARTAANPTCVSRATTPARRQQARIPAR
jgi:hypothetical protein